MCIYAVSTMGKKQSKRKTSNSRLMVSFQPKQRAALQEIAEGSGVSESQVVLVIVDEFLERNSGKKVRFTLTSKES